MNGITSEFLQYVRICAEICAAGVSDQLKLDLMSSMDTDFPFIEEILARADEEFEDIKDFYCATELAQFQVKKVCQDDPSDSFDRIMNIKEVANMFPEVSFLLMSEYLDILLISTEGDSLHIRALNFCKW